MTHFRRKSPYRDLRFAGYYGGDYARNVHPHIHGVLEVRKGIDIDLLHTRIKDLWSTYVHKLFQTDLDISVHKEPLICSQKYLSYCARYEGKTFEMGDKKVIINNSYLF